jgi:hypothetical protein
MTFRLELGIYPGADDAIPASEYLRRREADPRYPPTDTYYSALLFEVDGTRFPMWGWGMVHLLVYQLDAAVARLRSGLPAIVRSTADEVNSCLWLQPRGPDALGVAVMDLRDTEHELFGIPEDDLDALLHYLAENRTALLKPTGHDDVVCDVEIGPLDDAIRALERMAEDGRRVLADEARSESAP